VTEIVAFKVDLGSYDTIRLGICVASPDRYCEVDEDWSGFGEFLTEVHRRFDITDKEWWQKTAFPAFAENRTVLWRCNRV
jgi:hypothetical protein